jgi:group II intron reverse transcriptase/maturase
MHYQNDNINHGSSGRGSTKAAKPVVQQAQLALTDHQNLTNDLMKEIASINNLKRAFKSVKRNKGAPGIDKTSIEEIDTDLDFILRDIASRLLDGSYKPSMVRAVTIPKDKGTRQLGIPTVKDRIVTQAIAFILNTVFEPLFSESSYGFRPKRNAGQAIKQAKQYVEDDRIWTVDIDLENFFDTVAHDKLMSLVAKEVKDKALLKLVRKFLQAGVMRDGVCIRKGQGTAQGSPLSPILSNIMLHELDKELERRNHSFCRYADDCNIYVRSKAAGLRVLQSITRFIQQRLKLRVNKDKSAVDKVGNRNFLGFTIRNNGGVAISDTALRKFKDKIRKITKRNRGRKLETIIKELTQTSRGWFHYFKISESESTFKNLDCWSRRKIRCYRLKQRKRKYSIKTFLEGLGIPQQQCWKLAGSDKGWWRKSLNHVIHRAMNLHWFKKNGFFSLHEAFGKHKSETAVCDIARTVV